MLSFSSCLNAWLRVVWVWSPWSPPPLMLVNCSACTLLSCIAHVETSYYMDWPHCPCESWLGCPKELGAHCPSSPGLHYPRMLVVGLYCPNMAGLPCPGTELHCSESVELHGNEGEGDREDGQRPGNQGANDVGHNNGHNDSGRPHPRRQYNHVPQMPIGAQCYQSNAAQHYEGNAAQDYEGKLLTHSYSSQQ